MSDRTQERTYPGDRTREEWFDLSPADRKAEKLKALNTELTERQKRNVAYADTVLAERLEREAEAKAQRDAQEVERTKATLRRGFFAADPSATQQDFEAALPKLLEQHREQSALTEIQRSRQTLASRMGGRLV
jgi:GTPase involved in cell partitioning and DNA repair